MIGEDIHEEVLRALVEQYAVRECLVARINGGSDWAYPSPRRQRSTLSAVALAT